MARNDVARRCFQSLANACLEEDIHDDGDGEGVSEKAKEALCTLAAAQPLAVAVAVRTSLASDDIGRREGVGWRGVRRLLEAACCAARSVEAFAKHGSTPAGAGSKVTTMNEKEVDEAVDALAEAAVNELLQGAIENVADAVAVVCENRKIDLVYRFIPTENEFMSQSLEQAQTQIQLRTFVKYPEEVDITEAVMEELGL